MELTERQIKIIEALQKCNNTANGKFLSAYTGYSLRTIQSEMVYLKEINLVSSSKKGYTLIKDIDSNPPISDEEIIIKKLLTQEEIDFFDLADELYISESKLKTVIKKANTILDNYNLKAIVKNNSVFLNGKELDKRKTLRKMIFKDANNDDELIECFNDIDIIKLKDIVVSTIDSSGYYIQYPYANNLFLAITICLYRVYKGSHTPDDYCFAKGSYEYELALKIVERFYEHFRKETTESDVCYIASMFEGQIVKSSKIKNTIKTENMFESKITKLLTSAFGDYGIHINSSSYIHNFIIHVSELVKRGKINNFIVNSTHTSIKEKCPYIYDVAVHFAKSLEIEFNFIIPDDEIAFLAMHIGLIISSETKQTNNVNILCYISNYHGMADRIIAMIKERHSNQILISNIDPHTKLLPKQEFDLIITTERLDIIGKNVVNITPFFDIVDRTNVDTAISNCLNEKKKRNDFIRLMECFTPDLFFIRNDINDSSEAIRFLGNKLIDYGIVADGFIESVYSREELSPTSFYNSFAIPHSIENNAKKTMFAVLINENGISWHDTKVKLCLMICIRKNDLHDFPDLYDGVVRVLCDPVRLQKLIESKSLEEFTDNLQ